MNLFNSRRESELASITSYKYVPIAHLVGNIFHVFSSVSARKISNFLDLDWTVWGCVCLFSSLRNNKSNYSLKERKSYFLTFALWGKGFVYSCLADWKNDWELQTKLPPSSGQWTETELVLPEPEQCSIFSMGQVNTNNPSEVGKCSHLVLTTPIIWGAEIHWSAILNRWVWMELFQKGMSIVLIEETWKGRGSAYQLVGKIIYIQL